MPLSNDTKIAKSFRALINKEYSTLQKKFFEEFGANTINISLDEIWSSAIDLTASNAEAAGIVKKYTDFELAPLQGFNQSGKPLAYYFASGSGFTPGTQIRIKSPSDIKKTNIQYLLLLSWNLKKEIIKQEKFFIQNGGKFIIPFPTPKIIKK